MKFTPNGDVRSFLSGSGIKLPLKLVEPLDELRFQNRNTYFLGYYDEEYRLTGVRKIVYAEIENMITATATTERAVLPTSRSSTVRLK